MRAKRSITLLAGVPLLLLAALALAGCGGGGKSSGSSSPTKAASAQSATVSVSNESLGNILVDSQGRTLYLFTRDSGGSECSGDCADDWPPLQVRSKPTIGGDAKASLVSTTTRSDGAKQVTYNGHPLYRFEDDKKPGQTNGEGLNAFGGVWYAISPAGDQVSPAASTSGGGGSGY